MRPTKQKVKFAFIVRGAKLYFYGGAEEVSWKQKLGRLDCLDELGISLKPQRVPEGHGSKQAVSYGHFANEQSTYKFDLSVSKQNALS